MANNLLSVWSTIGGILLAILILLVMITVHEFGHYLAGKLLGFRIDEFSIGFGPALFKKRRKKSGELFAVRIFPLGGYCAFHGEDGLEPSPEKREGDAAEHAEPTENAEPAAEPASEEQKREPAPAETVPVSVSAPDSPPEEPAPEPAFEPKGGSFTEMAPWRRILVLIAGAFMNYLLALFLILVCFFSFGQSFVRVKFADGAEAEEYSLKEGDILLGADGKNFYLTNDIGRALNGKKAGDEVVFRVARRAEDGYAETEQTVRLRCDVTLKNSTDFTGVWKALGAGIEEIGEDRYYAVETARYRLGFFPTVGHSFAYSYKIAGSVLRVIGELFTGRLGLEAFGGPVTTITTTAEVASQGFASFLEIAALIGVNLAVFNLLPVPALDGCKVVFTAIEWIRGKPISRKVEAIIHTVGFFLLIGFAILVDVLQFV